MKYYDGYLSHHGILGQKWGKLSGPPYPLGKGDHSAAEKRAAEKVGVKVGKDSGKGSIEKVKKAKTSKPRKTLTEEEKRTKAEEARLKGDSKNINKYMDKLTTQELQDAQTRARIRKDLEGPQEKRLSKSEKDRREAMLSGDKEKIREHASEMTYFELKEAMDKMDLMEKLNRQPPAPTTMDKIDAAMKKVDKAKNWMRTGLDAYDALAAINNTFNKDHQWPRPKKDNNNDEKKNDEKKKDSNNSKKKEKALDRFEKLAKDISSDVNEAHQENVERESKQAEKQAKKEAKKEAKKSTEKQESQGNSAEKVKGKTTKTESSPIFDPQTAYWEDAEFRDLNVNTSSYSTGASYLNRYITSSAAQQYYLEDKSRRKD